MSIRGIPRSVPAWLQAGLVAILSLAMFMMLQAHIAQLNATQVEGIVGGDSLQYHQIALGFHSDGFSMAYEKDLLHRQPLYPVLLWIGMAFGLDTPLELLQVNVFLMVVSVFSIYFFSLWVFKNFWLAIFVCVCWVMWPLPREVAATRLLTEPLFCILIMHAALAFIGILRGLRPLPLFLTFACLSSLSYQTRPNGLFIFASGFLVLSMYFLLNSKMSPAKLLGYCLAAGLTFTFFSAPTLVAKYQHRGNPLDHGYLSNFLWAETYDEGKQIQVRITFSDFVERNSIKSSVKRLLRGYLKVTWGTLVVFNRKFVGLVEAFVFLGLLGSLFVRSSSTRYFGAWAWLSMLMIAWSFKANPVFRIANAQIMPLGLVLLALNLERIFPRLEHKQSPKL